MPKLSSLYTHAAYLLAIVFLGGCLMYSSFNKGYEQAETKYTLVLAQVKSEAMAEESRQLAANLEAKEREAELIAQLEDAQTQLEEYLEHSDVEAKQDERSQQVCLSAGAAKRVGGVK